MSSTSQYAVTGQHHLHSRQQSVNSTITNGNGGLLLMPSINQELTIMNNDNSPLPSLAGSELTESLINLQIFVPELQIQVCFF
uniref:Uncharacterized protein n=1 Tax=Panagrolaimus sp. PS1159 TaxID=55785 RepID=A0AC35G341_9BILA